jgi:hypothetical protein
MKLKILDIDSNATKPKATIHITGKLGFNMEASKMMDLSDDTYYQVAVDEETGTADVIYFIPATADTKGVVKVAKAGSYFYINLGTTFSKLDLKYEKFIISFDISKTQYEGDDLFVLKKRRKEKLRDGANDKDDD